MKDTISYNGLDFSLFISREKIDTKVDEIALFLDKKLEGKDPIFLGVLNGCFVFMADLVRQCKVDNEVRFVKLSSYDGVESTGQITIELGLDDSLKNRNIVVVEDIIDTGATMEWLTSQLNLLEVSSITIVTLLLKPDALNYPIKIDKTGFEIPNDFVIGYGLDYNGKGRHLNGIYKLRC